MRHRIWILAGSAAIGLTVAACGSSGGGGSSSPAAQGSGQPAASASMVKSGKAGGATVLTNAAGRTLYWFAIDTPTKSKCNGGCTHFWPPVKGPVTMGSGVKGKVGTIKRSDGSIQATFNGHPLYTFAEDHSPGQATGNGKNLNGGVWHEVTLSGKAAGGGGGSGGGGYGY